MNKKLIEQIKNLPGVKLVEQTPHCSLIVVFEPEIDYIQCNTKEEYYFLFPRIHRATSSPKWEDLVCHPVWIKMEAKTVRECTATVVEPRGKTIDASEYINPNLTEAFQEYMVDEALRRFPEGCTAHWASENITLQNIKRPFKHMGKWIIEANGKCLWFKHDGWAELVKEKPEEKKLEKYERILMSWPDAFKHAVYSWLKKNKPEVYWREVLKVIAYELNEGYSMSKPYHIGFKKENGAPYVTEVSGAGRTPGEVIFWSKEATKEAINIMGDKLRYLNGQPAPES